MWRNVHLDILWHLEPTVVVLVRDLMKLSVGIQVWETGYFM